MNDEWYICDVWDVHAIVIRITTCMSMSMTTGRSHRSSHYFLYDLRVIEKRHVNYFTLLLNALAVVVEVIVGEQLHGDTMMEIMMMEIMVSCWWQDDHGAPRWRSKELCDIGHIMSLLLFDCMWCLSCLASCLLRTTVVNKMIPHNNFKKVFPLTVHHCDSSLFRSTTWWSGVRF